MITITSTKSGFTFATEQSSFAVFTDSTSEHQISLQSTPADEPSTEHLSWPGEYDFSGTAITGVGHEGTEAVSYVLQHDQVVCGFMCSPLVDVSDDNLERLGNIDVLVLPAAKGKLVQKIVDEIDPRIVIARLGDNAEENAETLKTLGAEGQEQVSNYKVKSLPNEGRETVVFKA